MAYVGRGKINWTGSNQSYIYIHTKVTSTAVVCRKRMLTRTAMATTQLYQEYISRMTVYTRMAKTVL